MVLAVSKSFLPFSLEFILITLIKFPSDKANSRVSVLIHLELSKAFDLVAHGFLPEIPSSLGFQQPVSSWLLVAPPFLLGAFSQLLLTLLVLEPWGMPGISMDLAFYANVWQSDPTLWL